MNKDLFAGSISIMCMSLPCPHQEKRVSALYTFYGSKPREVIEKAAKDIARNCDRFPTPKTFGDYVDKNTPHQSEYTDLSQWKPRPRMTDEEFKNTMCKYDVGTMLLGTMVIHDGTPPETSPEPVRRIWKFGLELGGHEGLKTVQKRCRNVLEKDKFYDSVKNIKIS